MPTAHLRVRPAQMIKRLCRKLGMPRWPYRQIYSINKSMEELEAQLESAETEADRARYGCAFTCPALTSSRTGSAILCSGSTCIGDVGPHVLRLSSQCCPPGLQPLVEMFRVALSEKP